MTYFTADTIYTEDRVLRDHYFSVENGMIHQVAPLSTLDPRAFRDMIAFEDAMIIPGLINSHTHSFQSLLKGFCDDRAFFDWRDNSLYKYANLLSREDIYTGALFAFSEMLKQGITTVCDFFYINDQGNENARAVIQAALDLGVRITLARTMYDWEGAPKRFQETVDQAVANTESLMSEFADHSLVSILPAPHSLHGASPAMIRAGAELAQAYDSLFHMHVAEGQYERQMILERHGVSPIQYLNQEGILSSRMVGIHCVWLDDADIRLMAEAQAKVSYNPSSNMFLGDGITNIKAMLDAGITISLGTDGGCSNNRASIIEEMRMTSLLQKVKYLDSTVTTAEQMFILGTVHGGKNLNQRIGKIEPGYAADFVVIDLEDLSMQPRRNAVKNLVYSAMPSAIQVVFVNGRKVFEMGEILTVSESHIVERIHRTTHDWEDSDVSYSLV